MTIADDCETVLFALAELAAWVTPGAIADHSQLTPHAVEKTLQLLQSTRNPQVEKSTQWIGGRKTVVYRLVRLR